MAICNWVFQAPKHYLVKVPLLGCGSPQNRLHEHHEGRGFYLMRLLLYPLYLEPSTWHTNLDKYLISDRCILSCKYPHLPLDGSCALSVQFSRSVVSDSLRPHKLQHTRPPCPSPTPGISSNSSSLSPWCHPTISCFVIPFSSHLQPFPASGSFPMTQFFASGGQSIQVSASASVLPKNIQD